MSNIQHGHNVINSLFPAQPWNEVSNTLLNYFWMSRIHYMTLILTHAEDTDGLHNETGLSSPSITRYVDTTDFSTIATRHGVPREQKIRVPLCRVLQDIRDSFPDVCSGSV